MRIGIIADDLTGASDVTAPFRRSGLDALVLFDWPPERVAPSPAEVVTLDTEARHGSAEEARMRQRAAAQYLNFMSGSPHGPPLLYHKIDSTLRGHAGMELGVLLEMYPSRLALVTPAFPANGRTVRQGFLHLNGQKVDSGDVLEAVKLGVAQVVRLDLEELRAGEVALLARLEELRAAGVRAVVCDAAEDADLEILAGIIWQKPEAYIGSGSAGLASAIAKGLEPQGSGPVLLVNGSLNPVSRRQVEYLTAQEKVKLVELDAGLLLENQPEPARAEIGRCLEQARKTLASGTDTILTTQTTRREVSRQIEPEIQAVAVAEALAEVVEGLFVAHALQKFPFAGLVIVGGHTAINLCRKLGAQGLLAKGEVLPGIPAARLYGGSYEGFPVVSKAGGFGPENALAECRRYLKQRKA